MITTDVVIVGAGPCGLFQVFELGLLGLRAHVIDSIPYPGGQCAELYPDKPIYDIPAIPVCTGEELTANLLKQIEPFEPGFHFGEEVSTVTQIDDDWFEIGTNLDNQFRARAVVIAGGVGSFQPRRLRLADADDYEDLCLHYRVRDPKRFEGRRLAILGGGDSALDWALELQTIAKHVTLIHRRDEYRAVDASVQKMKALVKSGAMDLYESYTAHSLVGNGQDIEKLLIADRDKNIETLHIDDVLVFFGLAPKLGPIANWGLELQRKTIPVDTEKFETSIPGIFAVGDINTYPGKKKLILSGFHEAALAAFAIKHRMNPDKKVRVQYTTTSPIMHERLGIKD